MSRSKDPDRKGMKAIVNVIEHQRTDSYTQLLYMQMLFIHHLKKKNSW